MPPPSEGLAVAADAAILCIGARTCYDPAQAQQIPENLTG
jgi:hypothetical protein